ncbi:hypothetical protein DXG01_016599 [Tephrocybe rancida]|nr:hypothetical protein DXG01_016599 [Tephrocybe rancida]
MPGPGVKGKAPKSKGRTSNSRGTAAFNSQGAGQIPAPAAPPPCQTLGEDEMTRCGQHATEGGRCKLHTKQYRVMYTKYKEASKTVDQVKQNKIIPTKEQIKSFRKHQASETISWLRKYVEAIRVERTGRDIHTKRLNIRGLVDDGHKIRLKLLTKEMAKAAEALDFLHRRLLEIHFADSGVDVDEWMKNLSDPKDKPDEVDDLADAFSTMKTKFGPAVSERHTAPASDAEAHDLIDVELQTEKAKMLQALRIVWDLEYQNQIIQNYGMIYETMDDADMVQFRDIQLVHHRMNLQFARRIIWHEPSFCMKALDKVSLQDLFESEDFGWEDILHFYQLFFADRHGFRVAWLKDALIEAVEMSRPSGAAKLANVGKLENRFPIVGGWVYNRAHTRTMTNKAWWYFMELLNFPADVENRLVRLCHNYDDIISFLSFSALGKMPPPSFCKCKDPIHDAMCHAARKHLSLSGIIITDIVGRQGPLPPPSPLPIPNRRAKKPGCVVWIEMESRAHIFGALRNEPDTFTEAFLEELCARPDLFQVVTRSETDPPLKVDAFGDGKDAALPCTRTREFEAPLADGVTCSNRGPWKVGVSAVDRLYGTGLVPGHLTNAARKTSKKGEASFFRFLDFPVKHFIIMDTVPGRLGAFLAVHVAWAALRAGGYAQGEFTPLKYAQASDKLFDKCAKERLSWMPDNWPKWETTKMGE